MTKLAIFKLIGNGTNLIEPTQIVNIRLLASRSNDDKKIEIGIFIYPIRFDSNRPQPDQG
ncbi:hypothetical protein ACFO1S_27465 [Cohnella boryungensis]|uniref:Uncharacterized protein n=1 Tax=Cohnella boryungensis TaxID=768479 RepID=A0ABV8SLA8_9BACL